MKIYKYVCMYVWVYMCVCVCKCHYQDYPHEKNWRWLRKGNLKRETISPNSSTKQRHN